SLLDGTIHNPLSENVFLRGIRVSSLMMMVVGRIPAALTV
ncbi:hypothetical protein A2U01_0061537, partial [Trifolium medium]|nr:hypothetical protein [Trifolium medium]